MRVRSFTHGKTINMSSKPKTRKLSAYLQGKRQGAIRKNLQMAILDRDAERVFEISKLLGLKFSMEDIEKTFIV
mgnify:CR=1 FL=1|jgi:hypothetical protein